ncbi:hypothetical protein [Entomobacter blattae]|nr:hypothetical protein [Entomobacter blattae]
MKEENGWHHFLLPRIVLPYRVSDHQMTEEILALGASMAFTDNP